MERLIPIVSDEWYHVYNRGNDRRILFHDASDYRAFLTKMQKVEETYGVDRIAFVLMPNHFHTIVVQRAGGNLPRMIDALTTSYAKRYNLRYGHTGHVFEGRYHYTHIPSDQALWNVARYIHLNPVRARLAEQPEKWPWSDFRDSAEGVLQQRSTSDEGHLLLGRPRGAAYAAFVQRGEEDLDALRRFLFELAGGTLGESVPPKTTVTRRPSSKSTPGRRTP